MNIASHTFTEEQIPRWNSEYPRPTLQVHDTFADLYSEGGVVQLWSEKHGERPLDDLEPTAPWLTLGTMKATATAWSYYNLFMGIIRKELAKREEPTYPVNLLLTKSEVYNLIQAVGDRQGKLDRKALYEGPNVTATRRLLKKIEEATQ